MTAIPFDKENPKDIVGSRKPPLHLIPLSAKIAIAMALKDGVSKYGPFNWRSIKIKASPYVVAAQRHMDLWYDCSEECAKDSGVHHIGHAMATLAILYDAQVNDGLNDDRPIPSKASELMDRETERAPPESKNCTGVIASDTKSSITVNSEDYNPIDPSTWCDAKRGGDPIELGDAPDIRSSDDECGTNTWDEGPETTPESWFASKLESGTYFVDAEANICLVLSDNNEVGNKCVVKMSGGTPYIRAVTADEIEVNRVITQEEAMLLCT